MSYPRRQLLEQVHTISQRTVDRAYFLTPTPELNALVRYLFLLMCSRNQDALSVFTACFLSNHTHFNVQDHRGGTGSRIEDMCRDLFSLIARGTNAQLGRGGSLWQSRPFHNLEVHGQASLEAQFLYVWGQPTEAGLVTHPRNWPGFMILPEHIGRTLTARRPEGPFLGGHKRAPSQLAEVLAALQNAGAPGPAERRRAPTGAERRGEDPRPSARKPTSGSTLPEFVSYTVPVPPGFDTAELARDYFDARLDDYTAGIRARRAAAGRTFLGAAAVCAQDPLYRPGEDRPDFGRVPAITCLDGLETLLTLLVGLSWWRSSHREGVEILLRSDAPWLATFPEGSKRRAAELARLLEAKRAPP